MLVEVLRGREMDDARARTRRPRGSVLAGGDPLVLGCVRLNMVARLPDASP
ncbi:MAG: hypothetical protein ABSH51_15410 [Solirubrobacteraceae bacterium]|jgi:hypothetical protein